jgi:hypothetical protein
MWNVDYTIVDPVVYVGFQLSRKKVNTKFRTNESGLKIGEGSGLASYNKSEEKGTRTIKYPVTLR